MKVAISTCSAFFPPTAGYRTIRMIRVIRGCSNCILRERLPLLMLAVSMNGGLPMDRPTDWLKTEKIDNPVVVGLLRFQGVMQ